MKNIFSWIFALVMVAGSALGENCMEIYRRDLMETWLIPKGSLLCNFKRISLDSRKIGLIAENGTLWIVGPGFKSSIEDNYVSEKSLVYPFSVNVYFPNLDSAYFMTLSVNPYNGLFGGGFRFTRSTALNGHSRALFSMATSDIRREGTETRILLIWSISACQMILLIRATFFKSSRIGSVFNAIFLVGVSMFTGLMRSNHQVLVIIGCAIIGIVAAVASWANREYGNRIVSIACGAVQVLYYFLGGSPVNRYFFLVAFPTIFIQATISGLFRTQLERKEKIRFILNSGVFWTQTFQYWSYVLRIYFPEIFLRVFKGPYDYTLGSPGLGFALWWDSLLVLVCVLILAFMASISRSQRDQKDIEEKQLM